MPRRLLLLHASAEHYGSDRVCLQIAAAATAAGWSVDVIVPDNGPLVPDLRAAGASVTVLDPVVLRRADLRGVSGLLTPLRWVVAGWRLRRFVAVRPAYDVVHSNCTLTLGGALLSRRQRAAHVWHVHELFPSDFQRRMFDVLLRRRADVVLACSSSALQQFPSVVAGGTGRVVHPGVEVASDVLTVEPLADHEPPVVVCVGRLNGWKGQEVLIDAVALLRDRGVKVAVQLVGSVFRDEAHYESRLRERVAVLGLGDQVSFLGQRADANRLMGAADIAVLPSTRPEPFGIALVEAMLLGRPVIATAAGGPLEIVTNEGDGLLVSPGDARALADAIARLVGAPEFARSLGSAAALRAKAFTIDAMTSRVLSCYGELLGRVA